MRRRQCRLRLRQRLADELDRPGVSLRAAVEIALERRVEDDGDNVPDDQIAATMTLTGTILSRKVSI